MATTRLSDVIIPAVFAPAVVQRNLQLSNLWRSGIIQTDPEIDALAKGPAGTSVMPYWNDLTGRSNVGNDDPAVRAVPKKMTMGSDSAIRQARNIGVATMNLTAAFLAQDPADVAASLVAGFWIREQQLIMFEFLAGVLASNAANDNGDMVTDITAETGDPVTPANKLDGIAILAAKQQLGDRSNVLTSIIMHSAVRTHLQGLGFISTAAPNAVDVGWGTFAGYTVIEDDSVFTEVVDGKVVYYTYLIGRGAIAYGEGTPKRPSAIEQDESSGNGEGQEIFWSRRHFIMHLRGIKWTGEVMADKAPTSAELMNPLNWRRVYTRKDIRLAIIKSNG